MSRIIKFFPMLASLYISFFCFFFSLPGTAYGKVRYLWPISKSMQWHQQRLSIHGCSKRTLLFVKRCIFYTFFFVYSTIWLWKAVKGISRRTIDLFPIINRQLFKMDEMLDKSSIWLFPSYGHGIQLPVIAFSGHICGTFLPFNVKMLMKKDWFEIKAETKSELKVPQFCRWIEQIYWLIAWEPFHKLSFSIYVQTVR